MRPLFTALEDYQQENEMSDSQLSKLLGISHSTISRIKHGSREPGPKFLRAISREIPSLKPYVANFIVNGDTPGPRRRGRPTWRETLERSRVNEGGEGPAPPATSPISEYPDEH